MSVYSIHFSPTGGTKKVADRLISSWGGHIEIDLCDFTQDFSRYHFTLEDVCLISFPVFEGHIPPIVLERMAPMTVEGTPCVLAAVYGNRAINDALLEAEDKLTPMGFRPFGAVSAVAKHSTLPYAIGRPDEEDSAQLEGFSIRLKAAWEGGTYTVPVAVPGQRPYFEVPVTPVWPLFDGEKCVRCMTCAQLCPAQAIDHTDPSIVDHDKCARCARCLAVCPTGAWYWDPERTKLMTTKMAHIFAGRKPNELFL